ncbi:hypothetical protein QR721_03990 [Aciduricibacillus chroicocephali]|uniref:5,10-methylene-tetrahydrofolate dehydrogenase n=1 Tax=Aciduricibacillus chroicocephali TaxID=3054939 RepID=A0ABY9KXM9_9BACI|nr:hypothetical protein QR721_03990 [Bacillaceae bacterium 44XB]
MAKVTVGLVPAPELPEVIARRLVDKLPDLFNKYVDRHTDWNCEIIVDSLAGAAENVSEIINEAEKLKEKYDWTYAICLTDLPIFSGSNIVLADANLSSSVAQISLPAFGAFPMKKRIQHSIIQMVAELYYGKLDDQHIKMAQKGIGPRTNQKQRTLFRTLIEPFTLSPIRRREAPEEIDCINVRFIIAPRLNGSLRILFGMTYANRPWTIMPSFKNVVAIAFATGAYGLIFTTLWKLSVSYNIYRFIGLNLAAVASMVLWILLSHNLWETPRGTNNPRMRRLYNSTTISTLVIAVFIYYGVLFLLFLVAVSVFVPPSLFGEATGLEGKIHLINFIRLAWLVTSVATLAGAVGAAMENGDRVRNVTYGYRQAHRYEDIRAQSKDEDS